MNKTVLIVFILILASIAGATAWYMVASRGPVTQAPIDTATTTAPFNGESLYTNGPYGFVVKYPEEATVEYAFTSTYHLGSNWRANTLPNATGTPVVSFVTFGVKSDTHFPRYFYAMVRVGVSDDKREITQCLKPTTNQGETPLPDTVIGGVTWKAFAFQNAGMQQYVKGISYRTMHEGRCVALEQIATGSSYRDDPASPEDISQEILDAAYQSLSSIVQSFTFARP